MKGDNMETLSLFFEHFLLVMRSTAWTLVFVARQSVSLEALDAVYMKKMSARQKIDWLRP